MSSTSDQSNLPKAREFYGRTEMFHGKMYWVIYEGKGSEGFLKTPVGYISDVELAREICYPSAYAQLKQQLEEANKEIEILESSNVESLLEIENAALKAELAEAKASNAFLTTQNDMATKLVERERFKNAELAAKVNELENKIIELEEFKDAHTSC